MWEIIRREFVYIWYYFDVQLRQIILYWVMGMIIGSLVSVFAKEKIHSMFSRMQGKNYGTVGIWIASALGIASPLCMYGTIPIAGAFSRQGMREDWLAAFMMSSVLLNPQLLMYSTALGFTACMVRLVTCYLCGVVAGYMLHFFYKGKTFFNFEGFEPGASRDTHPNILIRFLKNLGRNIKATGLYFLIGVLLSALFARYVPQDAFADLFGSHRQFGVFLAATIGVPMYACGGGTIPLLEEWLSSGMSLGSAASFMLTGPATKITNLGALKIVLGIKRFFLYILFVMVYSLITGLLVNILIPAFGINYGNL